MPCTDCWLDDPETDSHDMIMVPFRKACTDFPRQLILLSEWMEWPKTFNELTGI